VKLKVDKTLAASIALHVLVIGWGLVSFSTRAFESMEESLPVDLISTDQLSKITAGLKTAKSNEAAPKVEKVAEAKPVDDAVGKVSPKPPVVTETAPPPQPKVEPKPVEKKPDPPKPVAEKPKEEPKPEKKQEQPKVDPIAEALKKEEKKPTPKPVAQAAKPPEQVKPKERTFDQSKIAALLDKRDPTRQSITGAAMSDTDRLGALNRSDSYNSANWKSAFMQRVRQCFNFPYNGVDTDLYFADIDIRLKPDGSVAVQPIIQGTRGPSAEIAKAMAENASRAVIQCQPYTFLPKEQYAQWQLIETTFGLKEFR